MKTALLARGSRIISRGLFSYFVLVLFLATSASAAQIDIPAPQGSRSFGRYVAVLPNGNFVVNDPSAGDNFEGAVYLYSPTGTLISTLRGNSPQDSVGSDPIVVLPNGSFVVKSLYWHSNGAEMAGAVTWVDGTVGLEGVVSEANSIVGSSEDDRVGNEVVVLANGNYVISSESWTNGNVDDAGAATFVPADGSVHGVISAENSLVGTSESKVGARIVPLANGNYLVSSPYWSKGDIIAAGAVTWASGQSGVVGTVSCANSLCGSASFDRVGAQDIYLTIWPLPNGNAVVISPDWDNGTMANAGAATWIDGNTGLSGTISETNSLVGTTAGDHLGAGGLGYGFVVLPGDRYAVVSSDWSASGAGHVGAITWGDGVMGTRGVVSASNSLVGTTALDLDAARVFPLDDGNWVVGSPYWSHGDAGWVGAATWIDGSAPLVGPVTAENSLIGTIAGDEVGTFITALHDGRYVVSSNWWHYDEPDVAGAVTWVDRDGPRTGVVSVDNSLVGTIGDDTLESNVVVLTNGNYLVASPRWTRDGNVYAGAVTWARGDTGITGAVSPTNSLVGDLERDRVGWAVHPLSNGNAVVASPGWHGLGAATWIDGNTGRIGTVSAQNSLVGSVAFQGLGDAVAFDGSGNYLVKNFGWNANAGAVAWGNGLTGLVGEVTAANALLGTSIYGGIGYDVVTVGGGNALTPGDASVTLIRGGSPTIGPVSSANSALNPFDHRASSFDYDATRDRLVVGWFQDNYVSLFQTETLLKNGFD